MTFSLVNGRAGGQRSQTLADADSRPALFQGATRLEETRVGLADLDLVFNPAVTLPFHPNGLTCTATLDDGATVAETYFSVGGGFVLQEGETAAIWTDTAGIGRENSSNESPKPFFRIFIIESPSPENLT